MTSGKVCILTGIYPPDTGGPATFAENFSEFLKSLGYKIIILTYTNEKTNLKESESIKIQSISRKLPIIFRYLLMVRKISKFSRDGYTLLANGCFLEIGLWSGITKKPYSVKIPGDIVWERARNAGITSLDVEKFQTTKIPFRYKLFKSFFWRTVSRAENVIAPSKQLGGLCVKNGTQAGKLRLIHNSVFIPKNVSPATQIKEYDFVCVSRLVNWKGIDELIRAISGLETSLLIVGDGPDRNNLELLALDLGANVKFVGEVNPNEVKDYLARSKYFVLNSKFEATSYAMLEAMSYGLIPIGNADTGSEEIILHLKNGLIVGDSTGLDLVDALSLLIQNPSANLSMSNKAIETVELMYNAEVNFSQILEIIGG